MYELTKDRILEIASTSSAASQLMHQYYPEAFVVVRPQPTVENAVNLTGLTVRNNQIFIANAKYLAALNRSPMYVFTDKALIVAEGYKPSIQVVNGRDLIVFELK